MNNRKIKLALTVGLMNAGTNGNNVLNFVKEMMLGFKEVGSFLGLVLKAKNNLNASHVRQTYAIQFEHCTVDIDLVSNPMTQYQYIQGFQLH